jgi:hypothetical protein
MSKTAKFEVRVTDEEHAAWSAYAAERGSSVSSIVRELMTERVWAAVQSAQAEVAPESQVQVCDHRVRLGLGPGYCPVCERTG